MDDSKDEENNFKGKITGNDVSEKGYYEETNPFGGEDIQDDDALFDSLMEEIGKDGKFQKRFNILYNFVLMIFLTMPYLNIILAMTIPEHWCHVPGRESTNYTIDEWREKWLPKEEKTDKSGYSACKMYVGNDTKDAIVDCQYGWDFDRQWYKETVPSEESWVCDKEIYVSNTFAAGRVGEIIGTFVFGQVGDRFGRKPVFYISIVILLCGRTLSVFVSNHYHLFLFSILLGSTASTSVSQSPLVISMEVSDEKKRSHIAFLQCFGWVVGLCFLAFISWVLKDWKLIMLVTTIPNVAAFCLYKLLPESPRWLASRGKIEEAVEVLKYLARVNNTRIPKNTYLVLEKIADKKEKFYGLPTLFANRRLAKNTIIIITCWTVSSVGYYVLTLNVTNMSGNPFMNFFWQSLVELPGYICGKILSDRIGRRWTQTGAFAMGALFCVLTIVTQTLKGDNLIIICVALIKLVLTTTFYMVWLQAIEIYPTCVRQTGTSVGSMMSNLIGILGPYIVYLKPATVFGTPFTQNSQRDWSDGSVATPYKTSDATIQPIRGRFTQIRKLIGQMAPSLSHMTTTLFKKPNTTIEFSGTTIDMRIPYVILLVIVLLGVVSSSFLPETLNKKLPETLEDAKVFGQHQKYWSFSLNKSKR